VSHNPRQSEALDSCEQPVGYAVDTRACARGAGRKLRRFCLASSTTRKAPPHSRGGPERRGEINAVRLGITDFEMMREDEDIPVETSNGNLCKE